MALSEKLQPGQHTVTETEFLALPPDGYKHELVDGEVTTMPASILHERLVARMIHLLYPHAGARMIVMGSNAAFRMSSGNLRMPDVSVMRREMAGDNTVTPTSIDGAPDLCVEVLSPSDNMPDVLRKLGEYFESGARVVWLVIAEREQIVVYTSPLDVRTLSADDILTAGDILPSLSCTVRELFALE